MVMAVWKFAPAIAAGNAVVLKPSDTTPVSTLLLAEIAAEFLPPGVLNVVCGDRDTGRALVAHPTPQLVSITGSTRAGMEVAVAAAADLKKVHLELGGKAPVVVFDDVDIAAAAEAIAGAGYFNAGQDCTAADPGAGARPASRDDFTAALADAAKNTVTGGPADGTPSSARSTTPTSSPGCGLPGPDPGPRARSSPAATGSATAATSSSRPSWPGCGSDDEMIQDEVFGPVITVQTFADEDEAVRWANDVRFGLTRQRVDPEPRPGDADVAAARLRRGLDQHPPPVRLRDAARRLRPLRLRQGPVDVRVRGVHPDQARHELHRRIRREQSG